MTPGTLLQGDMDGSSWMGRASMSPRNTMVGPLPGLVPRISKNSPVSPTRLSWSYFTFFRT